MGCGSGRFLRTMKRLGVPQRSIYGLELDEDVVKKLAEEGYQVYCQRVEEADEIPWTGIDLALMSHVIEHVDDPAQVVRRVRRWLTPQGVFAIETPNLESLDLRLFRDRHWGGYHIPRHWNLFTPRTLGRLLRAEGFEVLGVRYQTGHSFWMYSFHHHLRYGRRPRPGLARWFDPVSGLPFLVLFTGFDKLRSWLGSKTSSMLILAGRKSAAT